MSKQEEIILGIDLGTTNSLIAVYTDEKAEILAPEGQDGVVPSVVGFDGERLIAGKSARNAFRDHPEATLYSAKRFFGKTYQELTEDLKKLPFQTSGDDKSLFFEIGGRRLAPFEVSAEILKALKKQAEDLLHQEISKVVITVPAWFDDTQRNETRHAARLAGLDVVRMINEPTAAALAYGLDLKKEGHIAVYDFGGGTFDVSILELKDGVFQVLATRGDTFLGGDDIDQVISDWLVKKSGFSKELPAAVNIALKYTAEQCKIALSSGESAQVHLEIPEYDFSVQAELAKPELEELMKPLVQRTIRACRSALKDSGLGKEEITEVVLVGGSTRIPLVRSMVKDFFDKTPFVGLNPDEVVALGAAAQARILMGGKRDILLLDVIPLSLGLETLGGAVTKILIRGTTIPNQATEDFTTSVDNQTAVTLHVLQGERELVDDCRSLARFKVKVPPMPAGLPKLKVTFSVDENGMLSVSALEERSNHRASIEICPSIGLSEEQVDQILEDSLEHAMDDFEVRMIVELRNKAERILVAAERVWPKAQTLMAKAELEEIREALDATRDALNRRERDKDMLEGIVDRVGDLTRPLADLIFTKATEEALVGKNVTEV